ncbi:MAG: hypothetical protein HUJ57_09065 [Erysipelotrichaceae bacterium]|nr:hypothetical protein [Erysipelotrichaceae bacterium]
MSDKVSYAIKPNKKRIIKLVICWVLLGLAFLCSFIPSIVEPLRVFAYDHDWLNRRLLMGLADMIIMRKPLIIVLICLALVTVFIVITEYVTRPVSIELGENSLILNYKDKQKEIAYKDLKVIKHNGYAEIGEKKAWLFNQVAVDKAFYDELDARGVSYEK